MRSSSTYPGRGVPPGSRQADLERIVSELMSTQLDFSLVPLGTL